jgi:undecaprenyl-diphosphatase
MTARAIPELSRPNDYRHDIRQRQCKAARIIVAGPTMKLRRPAMPKSNRLPHALEWTALGNAPAPERSTLHLVQGDACNASAPARAHDASFAGGGLRAALTYADAAELRIVRRLASTTRFRTMRSITLAVNTLGNGWIYPPIAVALLLSGLPNARAVAMAALLATLAAHALYALLKRGIARRRPFEKDPALRPLARVLDRYSFPSGHCMTLTAVLLPIMHARPGLWPFAAGALGALAWCRLASAHHYPSDVLAGACVGAAIALPVSAWLIG